MLRLNKGIALLVLCGAALFPITGHSKTETIGRNYCHANALVAHATAEARQRATEQSKWERTLYQLSISNKIDHTNVLYKVLPKALWEVNDIYQSKTSPKETYIDSFNRCMKHDYGRVVLR